MTDVFSQLQEFSWRGHKYPLLSVKHSFGQAHQTHQISFRDGEFVEMTGGENLRFSYTLPMREDIAKGPYKNLFTVGLPRLFADTLNRKPGALVDPVYGEYQVVPTSFSDSLDPQKRDGTDVDIEFVEWKDLDEETERAGGVQSISGLISDSGALDAEVEKIFVEAQQDSPQPTTSVLNAIAGVGAQLNANRDRFNSSLASYSSQLEKIERQMVKLEDPLNNETIREIRRLRVVAKRVKERAEPTRTVRRTVTNTAKTLHAVAKEFSMSLSDLLNLNPRLAGSPTVPKGTNVIYYDEG